MMRSTLKVAAAAVGLALATPSSAAILFSDDFNRANSNTVGNGWSVSEDDSDDVAIVSNRMQLRDTQSGVIDASATQNNVSTVGFFDIVLSYDWAALVASESGDSLLVQWRRDAFSSWNTIATHALGGDGSFTSQSFNLGAGAAGSAFFDFRFYTSVSESDEGALIDNVVLSGTPTRPTSVPEPGTLALLGAGLLGLAGLRRRQRR